MSWTDKLAAQYSRDIVRACLRDRAVANGYLSEAGRKYTTFYDEVADQAYLQAEAMTRRAEQLAHSSDTGNWAPPKPRQPLT